MTVAVMQCVSCGGAIANLPGDEPRCLFCGRADLVPMALSERIEPPEAWLPFEVTSSAAQRAFKAWARRRFWAPIGIADATARLDAVFVPAWRWSGELETHWAGLQRAGTRSGKRPVTGSEFGTFDGILVPASPALTAAELGAISPFVDSAARPTSEPPPAPQEVGTLSRSVARARGIAAMRAEHGRRIAQSSGLLSCNTSSLPVDVEGRPVLLPVWIGAYVFGDRSHRVVLNGQSGAVTGTAPISWVKVGFAVLAALFVLLVAVAILQGA